MPTYKIGFVPTGEVDRVWREVQPYLDRVVGLTKGRVTLGSVYEDLIKNRQTLWIAFRSDDLKIVGACTTRLTDYPNARLLSIDMLGGDEFDGWIDDLHDALEQWAKGNECVGMEAAGRWGWARKLKNKGWEPALSIVEKRW